MALFTIGAVLARSQMNLHERVPARDYVPVALAKLLLHPLLVWGAGHAAFAAGVPLSPFYDTPPAGQRLLRLRFAKNEATLDAAIERLQAL